MKREKIVYAVIIEGSCIMLEQTFTDRQCELGQRTGSKSLMPVMVPMYLKWST